MVEHDLEVAKWPRKDLTSLHQQLQSTPCVFVAQVNQLGRGGSPFGPGPKLLMYRGSVSGSVVSSQGTCESFKDSRTLE